MIYLYKDILSRPSCVQAIKDKVVNMHDIELAWAHHACVSKIFCMLVYWTCLYSASQSHKYGTYILIMSSVNEVNKETNEKLAPERLEPNTSDYREPVIAGQYIYLS